MIYKTLYISQKVGEKALNTFLTQTPLTFLLTLCSYNGHHLYARGPESLVKVIQGSYGCTTFAGNRRKKAMANPAQQPEDDPLCSIKRQLYIKTPCRVPDGQARADERLPAQAGWKPCKIYHSGYHTAGTLRIHPIVIPL